MLLLCGMKKLIDGSCQNWHDKRHFFHQGWFATVDPCNEWYIHLYSTTGFYLLYSIISQKILHSSCGFSRQSPSSERQSSGHSRDDWSGDDEDRFRERLNRGQRQDQQSSLSSSTVLSKFSRREQEVHTFLFAISFLLFIYLRKVTLGIVI